MVQDLTVICVIYTIRAICRSKLGTTHFFLTSLLCLICVICAICAICRGAVYWIPSWIQPLDLHIKHITAYICAYLYMHLYAIVFIFENQDFLAKFSKILSKAIFSITIFVEIWNWNSAKYLSCKSNFNGDNSMGLNSLMQLSSVSLQCILIYYFNTF